MQLNEIEKTKATGNVNNIYHKTLQGQNGQSTKVDR